jgi:chromosome segregation ATPase
MAAEPNTDTRETAEALRVDLRVIEIRIEDAEDAYERIRSLFEEAGDHLSALRRDRAKIEARLAKEGADPSPPLSVPAL